MEKRRYQEGKKTDKLMEVCELLSYWRDYKRILTLMDSNFNLSGSANKQFKQQLKTFIYLFFTTLFTVVQRSILVLFLLYFMD